jgi:hypothetical protein
MYNLCGNGEAASSIYCINWETKKTQGVLFTIFLIELHLKLLMKFYI